MYDALKSYEILTKIDSDIAKLKRCLFETVYGSEHE